MEDTRVRLKQSKFIRDDMQPWENSNTEKVLEVTGAD